MQVRHQVPTLVFLLPQTCPMLMRDFLGKILSFRKTSSLFLWGPLPFPTSPTSPEIHHLFLPTSIFLLGRAFAGKRGGLSWWLLVWFCHLLINAKKCTDSSVGSSETLFRMPGPHNPPLWVLVANWGITGEDPTQSLGSGTTKKKRNSKRRERSQQMESCLEQNKRQEYQVALHSDNRKDFQQHRATPYLSAPATKDTGWGVCVHVCVRACLCAHVLLWDRDNWSRDWHWTWHCSFYTTAFKVLGHRYTNKLSHSESGEHTRVLCTPQKKILCMLNTFSGLDSKASLTKGKKKWHLKWVSGRKCRRISTISGHWLHMCTAMHLRPTAQTPQLLEYFNTLGASKTSKHHTCLQQMTSPMFYCRSSQSKELTLPSETVLQPAE